MKNIKCPIGNRTRDLLASSAVPQPTALPRTRGRIKTPYQMMWMSVTECLCLHYPKIRVTKIQSHLKRQPLPRTTAAMKNISFSPLEEIDILKSSMSC
jgi:hypothetical protein